MSTNAHTNTYKTNNTQESTAMNTINVTFNNQLPTLYTPVPAGPTEAQQKQEGKVQRQKERRLSEQKRKDAMHPQATDEQVADRWRILLEEHNMLMLKRISRQCVRGTADRADLAETLLLDLAGARCNTPAAEAVGLLDSDDGAKGRGRAHIIIRNMARNAAASLITVRDREVSMDFTEVQRQAVTASIKADGRWGKVDYDSAATINREVGWRSGDPAGQEWSDMEFRRGSERISEMEGGACKNGKGSGYKQSIHIHKERSLVDMLSDTMRVGGLHDEGRMDRVDAKLLSDWYQSFINMEPLAPTTRTKHHWSLVTKRAASLSTKKVRGAARLFLLLTPNAPMTNERLAMMDIVRGEVRSLGTLVVACTSATQERAQKRKDGDETTDEYMLVRWSAVLRLLGLDPTSSNRESMSKQVEHMAIRAGASAHYDKLAHFKSQLVRFPSLLVDAPAVVNKDAFRMANDGNRCGCNDMLYFDENSTDYKVYTCPTCRTMVRCTSTYANRSTDVQVQGLPMYMELRGEAYGRMHDVVCSMSGKQFISFNEMKASFIKEHGPAAVDNYLVYGCWTGMKLRSL